MKKLHYLIAFSFLTILSCKNTTEPKPEEQPTPVEKQEETTAHEEKQHWTYEGETGPEHWAEIEKNSDCEGKSQSPINIIDAEAEVDASLLPLAISYSTDVQIHDVTNNGHSIQYNFEKGDYITLGDEKYELKQIHFHESSEHTINGVRYPVEMHLVHMNATNQIAVLSVLGIEGDSSDTYTFLEKYLPIQKGETKVINSTFDLNKKLPENKDYYTYSGSLTTPPCTENVSWFVFKNPISVTVEQVKLLKDLMPINNYRDEQPLNDRVVKQYVTQ